uniref:protein-tyrosine-phosphatase n=1 Tax=Oreochromis niloticus TaxID=8128 RepID=A0A669DBS9_ORENI
MRTSEFDSSSDDEVGEEELTPLHISWLPLSIVGCPQFLGICALPVAACLLLQLSVTMTPNKAIEILRQHRGGGAIQTFAIHLILHLHHSLLCHCYSKQIVIRSVTSD